MSENPGVLGKHGLAVLDATGPVALSRAGLVFPEALRTLLLCCSLLKLRTRQFSGMRWSRALLRADASNLGLPNSFVERVKVMGANALLGTFLGGGGFDNSLDGCLSVKV